MNRVVEIVTWITVFPAMVAGALFVIGSAVETIADHREQHDSCLKRAMDGYEIRQCR